MKRNEMFNFIKKQCSPNRRGSLICALNRENETEDWQLRCFDIC